MLDTRTINWVGIFPVSGILEHKVLSPSLGLCQYLGARIHLISDTLGVGITVYAISLPLTFSIIFSEKLLLHSINGFW